MLTQETLARFDREVAKYPADQKQSASMSALRIAQQEKGWLANETIEFKSDQYVVSYVEEKLKSPSLFDVSKLSAKNKYEVFMRGNHPLVKIKTAARNQKSLLVIKDSYANCFIPFLTAHFSRITVVDPRYYYEDLYELIDSEDISHVLYLYNANTFFEDRFLASVLNNE